MLKDIGLPKTTIQSNQLFSLELKIYLGRLK